MRNVLCIQELNNKLLLHMQINVTFHLHTLLQSSHLIFSVETCRILVVTSDFHLTPLYSVCIITCRKEIWSLQSGPFYYLFEQACIKASHEMHTMLDQLMKCWQRDLMMSVDKTGLQEERERLRSTQYSRTSNQCCAYVFCHQHTLCICYQNKGWINWGQN
jgi:hypothetical protein